MRKLFMGTMLTSLLGSLVIGAVLAWTGSVSGSSTATAGTVSIAFNNYAPTGTAVSPTGTNIKVAQTGFANNGTISVAPNVGLPGSATVTGTSNGGCTSGNFTTPVANTVGNPNAVVPAAVSAANAFEIYVNMAVGAADVCQGVTINYDVTINVTT